MPDIKCFGCSFTKYIWNTWPDFLRLSAKKHTVSNFGMGGSSNEFICREIIKKSKTNDIVVVMWSGFDRVHSETYFQKNNHNMGKNAEYCIGTSLEQLYQRTLEYIWLANQFCKESNIKIYNFSMTILELGETKQDNKFAKHLDIQNDKWPLDFSSFCLDNPGLVNVNDDDTHPLPSQHFNFTKKIICPALNLEPYFIDDKQLQSLDSKRNNKNG